MQNGPYIQFVIGGSRCGKSAVAEKLAAKSERPVTYVATYDSSMADEEMEERVCRHRQQRPFDWGLIENNFDLISIAQHCADQTILIDCLTMWLSHDLETHSNDRILDKLVKGLEALKAFRVHAVIVSNEIGMGLVPLGAENRRYRDLVGWANQRVAAAAQDVFFVASGIPLKLKSNGKLCDQSTED